MEKPELEVRRTDLLRQEEDLKIQLVTLEDQLLTSLAESQGNILENKVVSLPRTFLSFSNSSNV